MGLEDARPGMNFEVYARADLPIAELRQQVMEESGLEIHIKMKVGPAKLDEGEVSYPIEAVDDDFLEGSVYQVALPGTDTCLYLGYFKPLEIPPYG